LIPKKFVDAVFPTLDKDGSGFLEKEEVKGMAKNMHAKHGDEGSEFPEDKFDEGFSKIDANGNGKLSKEEVFGFFVMVAEKRGKLAAE